MPDHGPGTVQRAILELLKDGEWWNARRLSAELKTVDKRGVRRAAEALIARGYITLENHPGRNGRPQFFWKITDYGRTGDYDKDWHEFMSQTHRNRNRSDGSGHVRLRLCADCGRDFDNKRRYRKCESCRESKRLADNIVRRDRARQLRERERVEPRDATSSRAAEEYTRQMEAMVTAHEKGLLCLKCLKPTPYFYMLAGSQDFYMKTLGSLGVPPAEVLILMQRKENQGPLRRTPICLSCAPEGWEPPNNMYDLKLLARDRDDDVRVKIHGDDSPETLAAIKYLDEQHEAKHKREEKEMARIKGVQKDMQDIMEDLTGKGYFIDRNNRGHFKVYQYENGPYITTVSPSPTNPVRTRRNILADVARWERENLRQQPVQEAAVPLTERSWSLPEMAAIIARYDDMEEPEQRQLLAKERVRRDDIQVWRKDLRSAGWKIPEEPAPLPDEPGRTKMCVTCATDKPIIRDTRERPGFWTQYKADARFHWSDECTACLTGQPEPVDQHSNVPVQVIKPVEVKGNVIQDGHARVAAIKAVASAPKTTEAPLTEDETTRLVRLMGRKREIKSRLDAIEAEKARLVQKLDAEKIRLADELNTVETELLDAVTG